jgi:hypothetical protein
LPEGIEGAFEQMVEDLDEWTEAGEAPAEWRARNEDWRYVERPVDNEEEERLEELEPDVIVPENAHFDPVVLLPAYCSSMISELRLLRMICFWMRRR